MNLTLLLGIPQSHDLGIGVIPGGSLEFVHKIFNFDDFQEIKSHTTALNPFIEENERFQIMLLLILSELNENASALRFRTAILSCIFHMKSSDDSAEDENQILEPYFQMICRVKKIYRKAKKFFDMFNRN